MERKDFIKKAALGGSILFTGTAFLYSCADGAGEDMDDVDNKPDNIVINLDDPNFSALKNIGGFEYKDKIIVIRISETMYVALSSICTHEGCTVEYSSSATTIVCPCHGSRYNTNGMVLQGPAPNSLKKYSVNVSGNSLTIS